MTKRISYMSILLALGLVLNLIVQVFSIQGMKVDFVVVMLCLSLLLAESYEETLLAGLAFGLLTALTTTFPNGQIANIIDKFMIALILYTIKNIFHLSLTHKTHVFMFGLIATLLSGSIFLAVALTLSQSLNMFSFLFVTIVIPSTIGNCIMLPIASKILMSVKK